MGFQSRKCFKNSRVTGRKPNALISRQNETPQREVYGIARIKRNTEKT